MSAFRSELLAVEEAGFHHGSTHQRIVYPSRPELIIPYIDAWRRGAVIKRLVENPFYLDPDLEKNVQPMHS